MSRNNDLRAMMKARAGGSAVSSAVSQGKEKARQLKLARQLQQQQNMKSAAVHVHARVPSPVRETDAPIEQKKSKTIALSSLVQTTEDKPKHERVNAPAAPMVPAAPLFAYEDDDDSSSIAPAANNAAGSAASSRQFYKPAAAEGDSSTATHSASTGGLGLPTGFFDNPREDIEARGLNVKDEIAKKEQEQNDKLESFLGEVDTILGVDKSAEVDSEVEAEEEQQQEDMNQMAVQLAYETKAAALMAKFEQDMDHIKAPERGDSNHVPLPDVDTDVDNVISEAAGFKRGADDTDIMEDVLAALQQKKRKMQSVSSKVTAENSGSDDSSEDDNYEPLDFTNWQSRGL